MSFVKIGSLVGSEVVIGSEVTHQYITTDTVYRKKDGKLVMRVGLPEQRSGSSQRSEVNGMLDFSLKRLIPPPGVYWESLVGTLRNGNLAYRRLTTVDVDTREHHKRENITLTRLDPSFSRDKKGQYITLYSPGTLWKVDELIRHSQGVLQIDLQNDVDLRQVKVYLTDFTWAPGQLRDDWMEYLKGGTLEYHGRSKWLLQSQKQRRKIETVLYPKDTVWRITDILSDREGFRVRVVSHRCQSVHEVDLQLLRPPSDRPWNYLRPRLDLSRSTMQYKAQCSAWELSYSEHETVVYLQEVSVTGAKPGPVSNSR